MTMTDIRARNSKEWFKPDNLHRGGIRQTRTRFDGRKNITHVMHHPKTLAQFERHAVQLMANVLGLRRASSPFTLVLDDLNQRASPLLHEFICRALSRNVNIVYVSFETKFPPHPAVHFVRAWTGLTAANILDEVERAMEPFNDSLVIVDSLYELHAVEDFSMNALFGLVAVKYNSLLVGVYHKDFAPDTAKGDPYAPQPMNLLQHLATTVINCKSFAHILAEKAAAVRSLPEPTFGLLQGAEGIIQCLEANDTRGIVLEAEFRRKSGRAQKGKYFLRPSRITDYYEPLPGQIIGTLKTEFVIALDKNPVFMCDPIIGLVIAAANEGGTADDIATTFELALTEKQKAARGEVVLPYFDAQKNMGEAGEGGRILYDMGAEDDFDEEEDEI